MTYSQVWHIRTWLALETVIQSSSSGNIHPITVENISILPVNEIIPFLSQSKPTPRGNLHSDFIVNLISWLTLDLYISGGYRVFSCVILLVSHSLIFCSSLILLSTVFYCCVIFHCINVVKFAHNSLVDDSVGCF